MAEELKTDDKKQDEKNGVVCPMCGGGLQASDSSVSCKNRKLVKQGSSYIDVGDCDFFIPFKSKVFKRQLNGADVRKLLKGDQVTDAEGNKMTLDLTAENGFYTRIEFTKAKIRDFN